MLSNNEIRVLDLFPTTSKDNKAELVGETRIVQLSEDPKYEALSYVWGDGVNASEITIDGNCVTITEGLAAALRRIRLPTKKRTLWVDQICINQDDIEEKAMQVPLMGQIYAKTTQCLIWFGEIDKQFSVRTAMSALSIVNFIDGCADDDAFERSAPPELESEDTFEEPIQALRSISVGQNQWWHRVWTLQEAILPSKSLALWGPLSIPWDVVINAGFVHLRTYIPALNNVTHSQRDVLFTLFAHTTGLQWAKEATHGPLDTAFRWNFRQASDPLDKVYGFLGLFPPGTLKRVEDCNYRLAPGTLYAMFTADLIQHDRDLHALALRRHEVLPVTTQGIPRWAMDMGVDYHGRALNIDDDCAAWYLMHTYQMYSASGDSEVDMTSFHYDQQTNALTLTGCMVDKVALVGLKPQPDSDEPGSTALSLPGAIAKLREWYALAEEFYQGREWDEDLVGPLAWPESFWGSLVANLFLDEEFAPLRSATSRDLEQAENFMRNGAQTPVCRSIFANMCHRTMFLTKKGLLGFGPTDLAVGDEVCILRGGRVPFIVRAGSNNQEGLHTFVGPSYLDGMMTGEALDEGEFTEIRLV
ncbi:unnamed protein product [Clonostachys chloroleuca]|uniref:Heterokaryon incompatibility domain-containing protein n=1 Tax=Clonostachys chloroleuca TaxID=1926264 RepID=A0AA35M621_9HYPO|nr:unnamed protein product [Clonostachys chloroleuca]